MGNRVVAAARQGGVSPTPVGREKAGDPLGMSWGELPEALRREKAPFSVVWLLDGAKHAEEEHLGELLSVAPPLAHVVLASTCTVYGDQGGDLCSETTELQIVTPHAGVKARCERMLWDADVSSCVLRLGALYGVDDRGVRVDRVQKWVTQAATEHRVVVPEPEHWRGWLHRDQAAQAMWRAARDRVSGVFNVASANMRFGDAAAVAADWFGAQVVGDGKPDLCNYRIDATAARSAGLLDEQDGEDLPSEVRQYVVDKYPGQLASHLPRAPD